MANLEPTMFREYDLRGRLNEKEINEASVRIIARAYGTMMLQRGVTDILVGHDLRTGSKELTHHAVDALLSTGLNVTFLGQVLTPMLYSAQYHYQIPGGLMVTASHNPNGWLGFKLASGYSKTFGSPELEELRRLTVTEDFPSGQGSLREVDYLPVYTKDVTSRVKVQKRMRVLFNAGNGTAGQIVPGILRRAGCEVIEFLTEPDLNFTHYFPNPANEKMMLETGEQTRLAHADLGIAIDGDGDRLGVADEQGQVVWPDRFMILLSRSVLQKLPNAPIVIDVNTSRSLSEDIRLHHGNPVLWKTGHFYIREKMHELDAPLAGEMSGHIFWGKPLYYGFDDAVFTALKMIELLSESGRSLSALVAETPSYVSTPTLMAYCDDRVKYDVVESVVKSLSADQYPVLIFENNPRQGARVEFAHGWAVVRASSNLPVISMRFEAENQAELEAIMSAIHLRLDAYTEVSREWKNG